MKTIKSERIRLGLTQRQLADLTGIPFRTIQNWETGQRKCPDYVERLVLEKLSTAEPEARWIEGDGCGFHCSACGEFACHDEGEYHLGKYCSNCGAKMHK